MKKRLTALALISVMLLSMAACFVLPAAAQNERVYYVRDFTTWNNVAKEVNTLTDTTGVTIHLSANVSFEGATLTPITTFYGLLDGHGKIMRNINLSSSTQQGGSLIGTLGGTIQNLHLDNSCTFSNTYSSGNGAKFGAFASVTKAGAVIYHCSSAATVSATKGDHVGGFVGTANTGGVIDSCLFKGTVTSASGNAAAFIGYMGNSEKTKVYNSIALGSVSGTKSGMVRAYSTITTVPTQVPLKNSYVLNDCMNVFFYNGTPEAAGAAALEAAYTYGEGETLKALYEINKNHVDTGREQIWFGAAEKHDGTIDVRFGSANDRVVKLETAGVESPKISYHAARKIIFYDKADRWKQNTVTPEAVSGMVATVAGAEYRNGTIYVGDKDITVTYVAEATQEARAAKEKLQALVNAYNMMNRDYFSDWSAKQSWIDGAQAVLDHPDATAAELNAQITAEGKLKDNVVAMAYPDYPSLQDYNIYKSIASIKDYSVGSKEEWLAAVAMSNFTENSDAVDFSGITIHLTKTIDMEKEALLPLCYGGIFDGNIDGHDYTFENICIEIHNAYGPVGLIAQIQKSEANPRTIRNLGIGSGNVTVTGEPFYKQEWGLNDTYNKVGCLVGRANARYFSLRKCRNEADLSVEKQDNVGGIIGDTRNSVTIDSCINLGRSSANGVAGYGQTSIKAYNSFSSAIDDAAFNLNPGEISNATEETYDPANLESYIDQIKAHFKNIYCIGKSLVLSHASEQSYSDKTAQTEFNRRTKVLSYMEAAWKLNSGYTESGLGDRIYFTVREDGKLTYGDAENQVRRVTLRCAGQPDQYVYGLPGQTLNLSYGTSDVEAEPYRYNYFALNGNYSSKTTLIDNSLTLGNEDVIVDVAKNVDRGDALNDDILDILDALVALQLSIGKEGGADADALAADVNSNSANDVKDALQIVRCWLNRECGFTKGLPAESRADYIKVLSYNIKSFHYLKTGNGGNGDSMYNYLNVKDEIQNINADIIGFQEVDSHNRDAMYNGVSVDQLEQLSKDLVDEQGNKLYPYNSFFTTVPDKDGVGGYGHGVMSKYRIIDNGGEMFFGIIADGSEKRGYAWYQLDINNDGVYTKGTDLLFYNCHLANATDVQLAYIADQMAGKIDDGHKVVCTGDFNHAAWKFKGCYDTSKMTALNGGKELISFKQTAVSGSMIDNIIVSSNLEHYWDDAAKTGIFTHYTEVSDHLPVYTYIKKWI